jgi:thymidine phosphorylase
LDIVGDAWLEEGEVGVSEATWKLLDATEGDTVSIAHPSPLESLTHVRAKIFRHTLDRPAFQAIMRDITAGKFSDVQLSAFVTACTGDKLTLDEITDLTAAMVDAGERLQWPQPAIFDKHCVGGLPGNRTTPLVVAIAAANGLCIPKTSSRAITSPAGTADTMETLAPVTLDLETIRRVVEREGGCIAWGGFVNLSPADDILIRVERALEIDSEGQLVASVLSKKKAAGATHVLIDIPVGATAKVRSKEAGETLAEMLSTVGRRLGLQIRTHLSDGRQPVGSGIGPALEANDLLSIFQNARSAPLDLREHALDLAGLLLEMGNVAGPGKGRIIAENTLNSGAAWRKFQAICAAQGGMREPPTAMHTRPICAMRDGYVQAIDNRVLSRLAKLAGAPAAAAAGIQVIAKIGKWVQRGEPLFVLHAETRGELAYALDYCQIHSDIYTLGEEIR